VCGHQESKLSNNYKKLKKRRNNMASGDLPLLGSIEMWPGTFAPQGWAFCDGSMLPISQYQNLFSLIGTTYGGNGTTEFALPDMRGRVPVGMGQGTGLPNFVLGKSDGQAAHTLTQNELPVHNHAFLCNDNATTLLNTPNNNFPAKSSTGSCNYAPSSTDNKTMAVEITIPTGGNQPHNNLQPFLAMYYIIATDGLYPQQP
jgi:microcystin-dependent protein